MLSFPSFHLKKKKSKANVTITCLRLIIEEWTILIALIIETKKVPFIISYQDLI